MPSSPHAESLGLFFYSTDDLLFCAIIGVTMKGGIYMTTEETSCEIFCEINMCDVEKEADKMRLYDPHFDMYIDEFDDADEDFVSVG